LAIHAKGGESISPKQKDCTTTLILKSDFQIGISLCSKGGERSIFKIDILNISLCSKGGESSIFKIDILKPS
jgi:hypothetical protein